jgi:hypothetical protein
MEMDPPHAEVVSVAHPRGRNAEFVHTSGSYESVEQLLEGCRERGPTVIPAASHLLRHFNVDALEIVPLQLSHVPESPPIQFASEEIRSMVQEGTSFNESLFKVLLMDVLRPFVRTHLPQAQWMIMHHIGVNNAREAVQIASVPSQLLRRIREMDLQVVDVRPPQPEVQLDEVLQLETDEGFRMVIVLQTEIRPGQSASSFFEAMQAWLLSLYPYQHGEISQIFHVMPNFSEKAYPAEGAGKDWPLRFRVEVSFDYQEFLEVDPEDSPLRSQWKELVARHTNGLKILAHFDRSYNVVAFLPGLCPDHGLNEIKAVILSYPTLLAGGEGLHIDWDYIPWKDGQETVWMRIAKVVVHDQSIQNVSRVLSDTTVRFKELTIRPVAAAELHSPFFQNNIRGHIHEAATREVITGGIVPVWADPHEVHISEHIAGQPLLPWQLSFTVAEYILAKSNDPEEELFDRSIFTQIVMGPKKGEISFVAAPGMIQAAWEHRHWVDGLLTRAYPMIVSPIRWHSYSPSPCPSEERSETNPVIPAHGFVENQDENDQDSVEAVDHFSAATVLKAPPEAMVSESYQGETLAPAQEAIDLLAASPAQIEQLPLTRELVVSLIQEIRELRLERRARDVEVENQFKELMAKQEVTTQSLTSLGHEITVLSNGASPDNISGLTGSSQTSLTPIILAINAAIEAAYSPGGIVAKQCEEDAHMTNEQFALMVRENVFGWNLPGDSEYYPHCHPGPDGGNDSAFNVS